MDRTERQTTKRILVADDEPSLVQALRIMLEKHGYAVTCTLDGISAFQAFVRERPDLVILDVVMPGLDGYEVCERIRHIDPTVPVIMLSARGDIIDKRVGFKTGADDYLTKPFNMEELALHVQAHLRRREEMLAYSPGARNESDAETPSQGFADSLTVAGMEIDPLRCEVKIGDNDIALTQKEFQIVSLLASEPGRVFTRQEIIERVWGVSPQSTSVSVPVYVRHIREKIEDDPSDPKRLRTVGRFGYCLGE